MELLVTLRDKKLINNLYGLVDGIIVGTLFSTSYDLEVDDLIYLKKEVKKQNLKLYVTIENFISEKEIILLDKYLNILKELDVDGIYFHDLAVYELSKKYDLVSKLIYDGQNILTNGYDATFYLKKGIDSVMLSRDLTYEEISKIITNLSDKVDLQIFGHSRLSYSKRKFLTNYFKEIDLDYDYLGSESLSLKEELRDYQLPIIETKDGTKIYSDYIFEAYEELTFLKEHLKRGVVDSLFINQRVLLNLLRDYHRLSKENASFLKMNFINTYKDNYLSLSDNKKTNIRKDEEN